MITRRTLAFSSLLVFASLTFVHLYSLDGLHGMAFSLAFGEHTEYAKGYSTRAFRRVNKGMTETEVRALLGTPLRQVRLGGGGASWVYSQSPTDRSYRVRVVVIAEGRVVERLHSFYLD